MKKLKKKLKPKQKKALKCPFMILTLKNGKNKR